MVKTFNRPSIISEGDSWFDYPKKLLSDKPSNIIDHVHNQTKGKVNLLRMESNGDEATEMLSGDQRHRLTEILFKSTEMGKQVDVLFFSAGGNDIVGDWDLERFLVRYRRGMAPKDCINRETFDEKLCQIELAYNELLNVCFQYSPKTVVISHTYDLPYVTGKRPNI